MRRTALLSLIACTLFGNAARADEAFDAFRNFCVASRAVAAPALAAADAAGWMPVPQQLLTQQPALQGADGRMRTTSGGALVLLTATGNLPQVGPARNCIIGVVPTGSSDLAGQLQAFAGVPKQANASQPEGFYAWRDENGRHVPAENITSGGALVAATQSTPQMTMIVLMAVAQ